jgi:hypothetical protein
LFERLKERRPAAIPGRQQVCTRVERADHELGISVAPRLVAVGGQEVGPARRQVAGHVLDNYGDAVGLLAGRAEELIVVELCEGFLGQLFVFAEAEDDVSAVGLPGGHGTASLRTINRSYPLRIYITQFTPPALMALFATPKNSSHILR